ncbi:MAG: DUF2878 domain-containing protein [Pseudomonadota bacterium]
MQTPTTIADDPPETRPSASPSTVHVLANVVAFQAAWAAAIVGAANANPWLGVGAGAAVLAGHLWTVPNRRHELYLALLTALIGVAADSLFAATGLLEYGSGQAASWLAPVWIGGLWLAFATTLNVAFRWLQHRWVLATVLGAVCGPLSYLGASTIGAVSFTNTTLALIGLSVTWALLLPTLLALASTFSTDVTVKAGEVAHV